MKFPLPPTRYFAVQNYGDQEQGSTDITKLHEEDKALKKRIRHLRALSRLLATVLSIGVFIPITITLHTYLTTRDDFRTVQSGANPLPILRNAWAKNTKNWPTYLYFSIALTSLLLNLAMLVSYLHSIQLANLAATLSTAWEYSIILLNFGFWLFAVIIYRTEKDKHGVHNDLWGWSCSTGAQNIQDAFQDLVNFERMCRVQGSSWIVGLVQVASLITSAVILYLVFSRRTVKGHVRRSTIGLEK